MRLHQLRRFASLSKTARVVSDGTTYDLAEVAEPETLSKATLEAAVSEIRGAAKDIAESQKQVARGMETLVEAINKPTQAVFDKSGKVIGSRKVDSI